MENTNKKNYGREIAVHKFFSTRQATLYNTPFFFYHALFFIIYVIYCLLDYFSNLQTIQYNMSFSCFIFKTIQIFTTLFHGICGQILLANKFIISRIANS